MSHNYQRTEWKKEFILTSISGTMFGLTSCLTGQPFDTIKTKMQAQLSFISKEQKTLEVAQKVWQKEGIIGFYRGALPTFIGVTINRSLQFSVFEAVYTKFESNDNMKKPIPFAMGLQFRVLLASWSAAAARTVIECPFEYAKVRRQTAQTWKLVDCYKGLNVLAMRNFGYCSVFFAEIDSLRRHTNFFHYKVGQFFGTGMCAVIAVWCVWPFENLKSLTQAQTFQEDKNIFQRLRHILKINGREGILRGIIPGSCGLFIRNGAAMVAMQYMQKKLKEHGYRD